MINVKCWFSQKMTQACLDLVSTVKSTRKSHLVFALVCVPSKRRYRFLQCSLCVLCHRITCTVFLFPSSSCCSSISCSFEVPLITEGLVDWAHNDQFYLITEQHCWPVVRHTHCHSVIMTVIAERERIDGGSQCSYCLHIWPLSVWLLLALHTHKYRYNL